MILYSFIRLCDYLVISMLHKMTVFSARDILHTLQYQTEKRIHIQDLVKPIPDTIEDQEKLLQVLWVNWIMQVTPCSAWLFPYIVA